MLRKIRADKRRAMIWGAGAKGVSYLNMLNIGMEIPFIVDINPHKQGKYIAGTGQLIVTPEFTKQYQPDLLLVMNPLYLNEIRQSLESMKIKAEVITV